MSEDVKSGGHTPTPWYADHDDREGYEWNIHILKSDDPNMRVAFMSNGPNSEANARLIVTAVNSHESLLACREALKEIAKLKSQPIPGTEFCTGPLALFQAAQRIALAALSASDNGGM